MGHGLRLRGSDTAVTYVVSGILAHYRVSVARPDQFVQRRYCGTHGADVVSRCPIRPDIGWLALRAPGRACHECGRHGCSVVFLRVHLHAGRCQVDVARTSIASDETATQTFGLGTGHLTPNPEGTSAQEAMVDGSQQVAAGAKEILHESVHR